MTGMPRTTTMRSETVLLGSALFRVAGTCFLVDFLGLAIGILVPRSEKLFVVLYEPTFGEAFRGAQDRTSPCGLARQITPTNNTIDPNCDDGQWLQIHLSVLWVARSQRLMCANLFITVFEDFSRATDHNPA